MKKNRSQDSQEIPDASEMSGTPAGRQRSNETQQEQAQQEQEQDSDSKHSHTGGKPHAHSFARTTRPARHRRGTRNTISRFVEKALPTSDQNWFGKDACCRVGAQCRKIRKFRTSGNLDALQSTECVPPDMSTACFGRVSRPEPTAGNHTRPRRPVYALRLSQTATLQHKIAVGDTSACSTAEKVSNNYRTIVDKLHV